MIWIIIIGTVLLSAWIASMQNEPIKRCFRMKELHDNVLLGREKIENVSDTELIELKQSVYTVVGMGGIGPHYRPSFTIWDMVYEELKKRRTIRRKE